MVCFFVCCLYFVACQLLFVAWDRWLDRFCYCCVVVCVVACCRCCGLLFVGWCCLLCFVVVDCWLVVGCRLLLPLLVVGDVAAVVVLRCPFFVIVWLRLLVVVGICCCS